MPHLPRPFARLLPAWLPVCPCLAQEKERVAPELERAEDAITEQRREVGKLKRRIDEITDRSFAAFSK